MTERGLPAKAKLLAVVVILSNLAGNTLLSFGVRGDTGLDAFFRPVTLCGIGLLIFWTLSRATLLSWADLSYVLPITAIGYVLTSIAGAFVLHEHISASRGIATLLIVAGVVLAGTTSAVTTSAAATSAEPIDAGATSAGTRPANSPGPTS